MKKVFLIVFSLVLILAGCSGQGETAKVLTIEEAKAKAVDFINTNLMQPGQQVSVKEAAEENGLYKIVVNLSNGQEVDSYITKDGSKFFPQVMDIADMESKAEEQQAAQNANQAQAAADVPKAETARVELFVMSHCPYGTQIEKGILPVLETLGDKVDFELKFCDYAMHGEKELREQLNQYCIQENEPEKLVAYLECFLADGDGETCLSETGVNMSQLNSCVTATDNEYSVMADFENKENYRGQFPGFAVHKEEAAAYGVSGSPSLVINGAKISSGRDSATLLKNICAGYENPPEECGTELSSAAPSPGFGFEGTGSGAAAECGT